MKKCADCLEVLSSNHRKFCDRCAASRIKNGKRVEKEVSVIFHAHQKYMRLWAEANRDVSVNGQHARFRYV
jgi:hypothetical protein